MNLDKANTLFWKYSFVEPKNETEQAEYMEALHVLAHEGNDPQAMENLGGMYLRDGQYELAEKYIRMAADRDWPAAFEGLGDFYFYGWGSCRQDYGEAFRWYKKAVEDNFDLCTHKLADMYRYGYGVEQDDDKYREIIETYWKEIEYDVRDGEEIGYKPVVHIAMRLADIRCRDGKLEEARRLYNIARKHKSIREPLSEGEDKESYAVMKRLITEYYSRFPRKEDALAFYDVYDLYEILKEPGAAAFCFQDRRYTVRAVQEGQNLVIRFGESWFRSLDDFFRKARIGDRYLRELTDTLYGLEIVKGE